MRIETTQGAEIRSLDDWKKLYDSQSHQWKEHRSAYSVADFMLNRNGADRLRARVSNVLLEEVTFDRAIPEYEIEFDEYGKGRVHDLAVFGRVSSGKSLFVGVEAKVDEAFGLSVHDAYLAARARKIVGKSTNLPERIEKLLGLHFSSPDVSMFDIRYQLLYATAGTLAANADVSILYVVVFRTPLFDKTIGEQNHKDYRAFVDKIGGHPIGVQNKLALGHEVKLGGRTLHCLHEYLDL